MRTARLLLLLCTTIPTGLAQWTKTVDCPPDRVYRDIRIDAGRNEYCELLLPGDLAVLDGPFRGWYNADFLGYIGAYKMSREIGKWKECDRFGRCSEANYPAVSSELPVKYVDGKYIFDFASCPSAGITHLTAGVPDLHLNIGRSRDRCMIAHTPEIAYQLRGGYTCSIPSSVGTRAFDSLDLISELPKLGLPQYCADTTPKTGPYPGNIAPSNGGGLSEVFAADFTLGNNGVGISRARVHFQEKATSRTDRCVVRYDPAARSFYLLSDQPGKYVGPLKAGSPDALWNSRCLLAGCSSAETSADTLIIHFALRFNPMEFGGGHRIYTEMVGTDKHLSPAVEHGIWTVPFPTVDNVPSHWPDDRSCPVPPGR
jgi:hypothetical protein